MHLVVGLGNPGRRFARTRHNAGFLVIDRLAQRWGAAVERNQFKALVDPARIGSTPVVLCKPQTFMNLSGDAVASLKGYYKVDLEDIVVVHDDVDLSLGDVRLKKGGGHGGHNGLRDLQKKVGNGFARVRFGVSRPPEGWDTADYVLGKFTDAEASELDASIERAADAVEAALSEGLTAAMQHVNARSSGSGSPSGTGHSARSTSGISAGPSRS